ncbi:hypothetical protein [Rhodococcus sp. AW25M09]|nr:hypothetical protein [Rhodococcus sp. AW25M09]
MSDDEIKAFVSLLLVAGGETTDEAISSAFSGGARHSQSVVRKSVTT